MTTQIERQVEDLFNAIKGQPGTLCRNPVTATLWRQGLDRIGPQKWRATQALLAREQFRKTGPAGIELPLTYEERETLKGGGSICYLVALYARSLEARDYRMDLHPPFEAYACGVMASPLAPVFIRKDRHLIDRYPPCPLPGLGSGLVWRAVRGKL